MVTVSYTHLDVYKRQVLRNHRQLKLKRDSAFKMLFYLGYEYSYSQHELLELCKSTNPPSTQIE